ncbi:unnamed protein product [Brachionus calyciflorus]|uniref:Cell division cycle protein 123 homolog n=1 Tax=Brachionus calyciflorus TaxID=104777 RepID=A0A813MEG2_9BILA|nr:unnamed protein product [Brachionus calyciflorus]
MSNFLEEIKLVKLRQVKTESIKDYSDPKLAGFLSKESLQNYQSNVLDCNFENWYEKLKDVTFKSEFCPIELSHAEIFIDFYKKWQSNKDIKENWKSLLKSNQLKEITELESRLDNVISKFINDKNKYVFVKTSSRSAKDSPLTFKQFKDLYSSYFNSLTETENLEENEQIKCLLKAAFECLKVQKASQVIEMFFKSERIYQDMLLAVEKKERFKENFIIREFVQIDIDMEFRGFVFNGKLTALSQYNYLIYSKRLNEQKSQIGELIKNFFNEKVSAKLEEFHKSYIIDFAVVQNMDCFVIEINPFLETTDSGLFSWQHERAILESNDTFCFRITERPKPGAKAMLPYSIRSLMSN